MSFQWECWEMCWVNYLVYLWKFIGSLWSCDCDFEQHKCSFVQLKFEMSTILFHKKWTDLRSKMQKKQQSNCFLLRLKESDLRTFSPPSLPAHWTMNLGMESYQWAQHDRHRHLRCLPLKCLQESLLHARVACEAMCYIFFMSLEYLDALQSQKQVNQLRFENSKVKPLQNRYWKRFRIFQENPVHVQMLSFRYLNQKPVPGAWQLRTRLHHATRRFTEVPLEGLGADE